MKTYDAIIIGSGQAGTPLSKKLAEDGLHTLLVEQRWIGGTCVNDGCTPTKAMIASARLAWLCANGRTLGVNIPSYKIELETILKRKNAIVERFRNGALKGLEKTPNLDV